MKKLYISFIFLVPFLLRANTKSTSDLPENNFSSYFEKAYRLHPSIPRGILEAVAYTNSHFHHITHNAGEAESCTGLPKYYGVMGLVADGKNYFQNNLTVISNLSGISASEIISFPEKNILAYAATYEAAQKNLLADSKIENQVPVLIFMSELPDNGNLLSNYAMCTHLYSVLSFLNNADCTTKYNFPKYSIDLTKIFGYENLKVLSSSFVTASADKIFDKNGNNFKGNFLPAVQSADYPPALWVASPNYNTRSSAISAVTIHDTEGSYAGSISWFQNTSSQVSAHYVVRSSDGQITQMVLESKRAWHVGSENDYTIGIEHEGYASQTGWYTTAMYTASSDLVKDICASGYGIPNIRTLFQPWASTTYYAQSSIPGSCTKIKGHQHYPNQTHTDPGPNWDWDYYYKLINGMPTPTNLTAASGTFYDSGGASGNYSDDEHLAWVIAPSAATSVTLTFASFDVENTWDYLYVYDGPDIWSPLIGKFTGTTNPGTLVANSGKMCIEFRSDCATNAAGWNASWTSNASTVTPTNLAVNAINCPSLGVTLNWQNSGSGWYVDVSDDPNFSYYWNKAVPNLTSIGCPGGFALNSNPNSYLAFNPNTTYYWRIWDGTNHTTGAPFTTPSCMYMDTSCSGNFYDTGGPSNPYAGNQDYWTIFQPGNAASVTMNFSSLDLELNGDSLWLWDGQPTQTPSLIGIYSGTVSPGTVTANSGVLSAHFKSDPFVNNAGWAATYNCTQSATAINEQNNANEILIYPNPFSEKVMVKIPDGKNYSLKIFDMLGNSVQPEIIHNVNSFVIQRNELPSGIYMLRFSDEHEFIIRKLIIE